MTSSAGSQEAYKLNSLSTVSNYGRGPLKIWFDGQLTNEGDLRREIQRTGEPQPLEAVPQLIARLYQKYGTNVAGRLKGQFRLAVIDETAGKVLLASDRLGSYPLYWSSQTDFAFADDVRSILAGAAVKPKLNASAIADYLTFGFLFGDKTLATGVSLLPPASTLTYCLKDKHCTVQQYGRVEELFQVQEHDFARYLQRIIDSFNAAVEPTLMRNCLCLSLSGGLDSRAILSALRGQGSTISTYTLGTRGCADEVIASRLARIAGTKHRFVELDAGYLTEGLSSLERMVSLTDGMYLTHGLTENLAMRFLEHSGASVLLRGHGGELAKASLA